MGDNSHPVAQNCSECEQSKVEGKLKDCRMKSVELDYDCMDRHSVSYTLQKFVATADVDIHVKIKLVAKAVRIKQKDLKRAKSKN